MVRVEITEMGMTCYYDEQDRLHRDNGPALVSPDKTFQAWYNHGKLHRVGGPAVVTEWEQSWWVNGKLDRVGGPACVYSDGDYSWYRNGVMHRDGGLPAHYRKGWITQYVVNGELHRIGAPAVIYADGRQKWYKFGQQHNPDGPAGVYPARGKRSAYVEYCLHGKRHRVGGPAVVRDDGYNEYWVNGELHRDGMRPACYQRNYDTGKMEPRYYIDGKRVRDLLESGQMMSYW